jgi:hypothetical protein
LRKNEKYFAFVNKRTGKEIQESFKFKIDTQSKPSVKRRKDAIDDVVIQ